MEYLLPAALANNSDTACHTESYHELIKIKYDHS
jgi:hypothetical protein